MTDKDIIDTIAEALAGKLHAELALQDSVAILAALRSAGYAIVELPKYPAKALVGGEVESVYVSDLLDEPSITISGTVSIYADEGRSLAAALLAAAAEADQ